MINGVSASDDNIKTTKSDKFVFSCQRALEAKGDWKKGSNCRGPSGDIVDVVFPVNANVEIIEDRSIKK